MSLLSDVQEFHRKFGIKHGEANVEREMAENRLVHLKEELNEFEQAYNAMYFASDPLKELTPTADMLDALCDLVWVALGTADVFGLPFELAWEEVKRANMSKKLAGDESLSTRRYRRDIIKPEGFVPPDIEGVMKFNPPRTPLKPADPRR